MTPTAPKFRWSNLICAALAVSLISAAPAEAGLLQLGPYKTLDQAKLETATCHKVRTRQRVEALDVNSEPTGAPKEGLARFWAQNGFPDTNRDGIERFLLTMICRCAEQPKTVYAMGRSHASEVACDGTLPGTNIPYNLTSPKRTGQCFVASQRLADHGVIPTLTKFFLETAVELPDELTAKSSYFDAGGFKLGKMGFFDVCNQDIALWNEGDINRAASLGGRTIKLRNVDPAVPSAGTGPVQYPAEMIAQNVPIAGES